MLSLFFCIVKEARKGTSYESCIRLLEDFDGAVSRAHGGHRAEGNRPTYGVAKFPPSIHRSAHAGISRAVPGDLPRTRGSKPTNLIEGRHRPFLGIHGFELSDSNLIVKKDRGDSALVATPTYLKNHGNSETLANWTTIRRSIFLQQGRPRECGVRSDESGGTAYPQDPFRTNDRRTRAHGSTQSMEWQTR